MRSRLVSALAVLGAAALLVVGVDAIALAANGKPLLLGSSNAAAAITRLSRTTSGPALQLITKGGGDAPISVTGTGRVTNLNADMLDGKHYSEVRTQSEAVIRSITSPVSSFTLDMNPEAGSYLVDYSTFFQNVSTGAGGRADCFVKLVPSPGDTARFVGESSTRFSQGDPVGVSGSGILNVGTDESISLVCSASNAFTTLSTQPVQLVLTPSYLLAENDGRYAANPTTTK